MGGGGGVVAKSYEREIAWPSINRSILSDSNLSAAGLFYIPQVSLFLSVFISQLVSPTVLLSSKSTDPC
jgi:hypothetical protein